MKELFNIPNSIYFHSKENDCICGIRRSRGNLDAKKLDKIIKIGLHNKSTLLAHLARGFPNFFMCAGYFYAWNTGCINRIALPTTNSCHFSILLTHPVVFTFQNWFNFQMCFTHDFLMFFVCSNFGKQNSNRISNIKLILQ